MATPLDPNGKPVVVGKAIFRTPGLSGEATVKLVSADGMRDLGIDDQRIHDALASNGATVQDTFVIAQTREWPAVVTDTRTSSGEPAIQLDYPDPGPEWGQMVLASDEGGVMTWNFAPAAATTNVARTGAGGMRTYTIRRTVSPAPEEPAVHRGLGGAIGKKILRVIAFPLVEMAGGIAGHYFARNWEAKHRPYRVRTFTPNHFAHVDDTPVDWSTLSDGSPALLMIHGTFSRTDLCFGGLSPDSVDELWRRYEGRLFAFDHPTLSDDPETNGNWFFREWLEHTPDNSKLTLDILCHSRGGLVARQLNERQGTFSLGGRSLEVRRIIFVATPNSGTLLADSQHMGAFIDTYTNILSFLPDNGVTDTFEAIVAVARHLAVGALDGLDGLQSMKPGGAFLHRLNQPADGPTRYFALAANYEPVDTAFKSFAADRLMDRIFRANGQPIDNDLVVPAAGVYAANGAHPYFPITSPRSFTSADGVHHTGFFAVEAARNQILDWLR